MSAKKSLKEKTNEVIADRMFGKAIADYGETSKRKVLVVTEFDNRAEIVVSSKIARKLEQKPELVKALKEMFELEDDSKDEDYELLSHKTRVSIYPSCRCLSRMLREGGPMML